MNVNIFASNFYIWTGPTHFVAGVVTGLHVNTPEEEEEARLVKELNALRAKVEAQVSTHVLTSFNHCTEK